MLPLFLSLTSPEPPGFTFDSAPARSRFRRGVFCLYSDDPERASALVAPIVEKAFGLVVVAGSRWEWRCLGNFLYWWTVPQRMVSALSSAVAPFLELIEQAHRYDDVTRAQAWDHQRAVQDRLFLSRVQVEFRDAMLRADKDIREAHRYLNQLIEFLPDALLVIDRNKKVIHWNKALEQLTGVPKEEMIGKGDYEYALPFYGERRPILLDLLYLPEDEVKKIDFFFSREGEVIFSEDFIPKVNNGRGAYALKSATLLHDQDGTILGAIETIRDITDRKKMEVALTESHAQLDAMANNVPGIVFQLFARPDGSTGFYYLSNKAMEIIGIRYQNCTNLDEFGSHVHPEDRERFSHSVRDAVQSRDAWRFEGRLVTFSGDTIWCQVLSNPVVRENELVYSGVIVDVTDRHNTMAELQRAKLVAEEANRAQSRFLSNVSHEIRTPLNGIIGFAELIMRERNVDGIHAMAKTVLHESEILLSLVNELLDQARIESGRMEIECVRFDINELIDTVSKTVGVQAQKKGLEVLVDASADAPRFLFGDPLRICQVLLNLMNNSMKFTQHGSITLRTRIERTQPELTWVRFEVIDTGRGIPGNKRHLIFERFAQVDAEATRKYGGTGLGLSVSRGLVELMGGTIGFTSLEGTGSTFWFVLPFPINVESGEKRISEAVSIDTTIATQRCSRSPHCPILLVEDYPPNQEVARSHLAAEGYTVEIVGNGIAALDHCGQKEYSLILMDIQMPEMDGFEATKKLRQRPGWTQDAVILGLTANADEKTRKGCIAAGMDGMVIKPIRREAFLKEVAKRLSKGAPDHSCAMPEITADKETWPMDYERALGEFMGDKALLDELIKGFIATAYRQVADMERFVSENDTEAVGREAHKIRGASANLVAMRLAAAAKAVELKSKSGEATALSASLDEVKRELKSLDVFTQNGCKPGAV